MISVLNFSILMVLSLLGFVACTGSTEVSPTVRQAVGPGSSVMAKTQNGKLQGAAQPKDLSKLKPEERASIQIQAKDVRSEEHTSELQSQR